MHQVVKTYGNERGLSCCFRQWRAESHCNLLHGYAIGVEITFESEKLDHRNWVVDFGAMDAVKEAIEEFFDHTLLIADDDPKKSMFLEMQTLGVAKVHVLKAVGCEAFAEFIYWMVSGWLTTYLTDNKIPHAVNVAKVRVFEHAANAATYIPE